MNIYSFLGGNTPSNASTGNGILCRVSGFRYICMDILLSCALVVIGGCDKVNGDEPGGGDCDNNEQQIEAPVEKKVKVLEFLPAPGQFINEGYDAFTMKEACEYAESRVNYSKDLSLGAFGGYVIVSFSKPVLKMSSSHEIGIKSNQSVSSSEPGIILVSRDVNGNGLADDPWYELVGELYSDESTIHSYSVTYFRPDDGNGGTGGSIPYKDNMGSEGSLPHLSFHQQCYYPNWVEEDSYTLSGTRLQARNYDQSGNGTMWINPSYGWGYVDNYDPDPSSSEDGYTLFSLSDAVDSDGNPVSLDRVDFIKVQTGVLAVSGWLGEASTEVCGFWNRSMQR